MKTSFEIQGKRVGEGARCFVIAEAGSNHNGSLETALALVDVASAAGADAVKFQTFEAKRLYPRSAGQSDYLKDATPIFDIIAAMEMPPSWLGQLSSHAHEKGLAFISSPFHEEAVEVLDPHVDAFKIASYELTHEPLLRSVAARGKPVILSTGASTMAETMRAVHVLKEAGTTKLIVLQCTAAYPTPPASANVRALLTLRTALGVPTGLSDHTRDPTVAPMVAVALGASVIEKHFTLSNRLPGPDHAFAVEPHELELLVRRVRDVETVLGTGAKDVLEAERELRGFARRSMFTTRDIAAGEAFTRDNVDVLRHGKHAAGLSPSELERVLRCRAGAALKAEVPLQESDLKQLEFRLRPAVRADCEQLYTWAMDGSTRAASFRSAAFTLEEHTAWFENSLANNNRHLLLAELENAPCGVVRLDISTSDGSAEVGVTLAPEWRGRGMAARLLLAGAAAATPLGVRRLIAHIKPNNLASTKSFERAGFGLVGRVTVQDQPALRYELEL